MMHEWGWMAMIRCVSNDNEMELLGDDGIEGGKTWRMERAVPQRAVGGMK